MVGLCTTNREINLRFQTRIEIKIAVNNPNNFLEVLKDKLHLNTFVQVRFFPRKKVIYVLFKNLV